MTYAGTLMSFDEYMNLQLGDTKEFIDGAMTGALGEVLIRCNNVLYVKDASEGGSAAEPVTAAADEETME